MAETGLPHTSINWLWETAGYEEGIITIRAVAADILGQENSHQVSVLLDRTPPGPVSLHEPLQGQSGVKLPLSSPGRPLKASARPVTACNWLLRKAVPVGKGRLMLPCWTLKISRITATHSGICPCKAGNAISGGYRPPTWPATRGPGRKSGNSGLMFLPAPGSLPAKEMAPG